MNSKSILYGLVGMLVSLFLFASIDQYVVAQGSTGNGGNSIVDLIAGPLISPIIGFGTGYGAGYGSNSLKHKKQDEQERKEFLVRKAEKYYDQLRNFLDDFHTNKITYETEKKFFNRLEDWYNTSTIFEFFKNGEDRVQKQYDSLKYEVQKNLESLSKTAENQQLLDETERLLVGISYTLLRELEYVTAKNKGIILEQFHHR